MYCNVKRFTKTFDLQFQKLVHPGTTIHQNKISIQK